MAMAAGTAQAFTPGSTNFGGFNSGLSTPDKFWGTEVLATASTGGFWEDDPEEVVKKKVNELKRKFHVGRQLQIKHLPRDVTEEEICELLSDFPIQQVHLHCGTGSGVARAVLEDPEMLEDWDKDRIFLLRGQRVPVVPTNTEMMLCVARLPPTYTEAQFNTLVGGYGEVCRSFLMISEKTGESKGYGFVEYASKEVAMQAKNILDGKEIDNSVLCCDWLDSSHITFESLHSKCLYVDKLPKDFRDMGEFRRVFSTVVNPPYCQIALKNGCLLDWGLVEYSTSDEAEAAQVSLNGHCLRGENIRISYCIPGVRAINLYLKLLSDSNIKDKTTGLLPDPPAPAVFQQLQNLARQNPVFAQSLQNIIMSQSHNHGEEKTKHPLSASQMLGAMGNGNPFLGNLQMTSALQNLIDQESLLQNSVISPNPSLHARIGPPPSAPYNFGAKSPWAVDAKKNLHSNERKDGFVKHNQQQKVPLLSNPAVSLSPPTGESGQHTSFSNHRLENMADTNIIGMSNPLSAQDQASIWSSLHVHAASQQIGSTHLGTNDAQLPLKNGFHSQSSVVTQKSPLHIGKSNNSHFSQDSQTRLGKRIDALESNGGDSQERDIHHLLGSLTNVMQNSPTVLSNSYSTFPFINQASTFLPKLSSPASQVLEPGWPAPSQTLFNPATLHNAPVLCSPASVGQPMIDGTLSGLKHIWSTPVAMTVPPSKPVGFVDMKGLHSSFQNGWMQNSFIGSPSAIPPGSPTTFSPYSGSGLVPHVWSPSASPFLISSPPSTPLTPVGHKRKYNRLLPSPEPSPEGTYIGQHSQGIGGHYADSYFKRKKKN